MKANDASTSVYGVLGRLRDGRLGDGERERRGASIKREGAGMRDWSARRLRAAKLASAASTACSAEIVTVRLTDCELEVCGTGVYAVLGCCRLSLPVVESQRCGLITGAG